MENYGEKSADEQTIFSPTVMDKRDRVAEIPSSSIFPQPAVYESSDDDDVDNLSVKVASPVRKARSRSPVENARIAKNQNLPKGVYMQASGKYQACICLSFKSYGGFTVGLGSYTDVETASKAFQCVYKNPLITAKMENETDITAVKEYVKKYVKDFLINSN